MSRTDIVLRIINEICPFSNIDQSTELIESEIITSLILFELVAELEAEFGIRINEELIAPENFITVEKIVDTVLEKVE